MSKNAKGINTDKVFAMIEKADLDEQVRFFHEFKSLLNKKLDERDEELEKQKNKYQDIKDQINKNGNAGTGTKNS